MSLQPQTILPIPEETVRVAHAIFPSGNRYMRLRDELGTIYTDAQFAALYPAGGQFAEQPWRIALLLVMQYMENYTDRQAAEAMKTRIDTHVLAAIRTLNRLECVGETLRAALKSLAVVVPDWVRQHIPQEWYERYGSRVEDYHFPKEKTKRQVIAEQMGADGWYLLSVLSSPAAASWLGEVPAVLVLRRVWVQQYGSHEGTAYWRPNEEIPPASLYISSPYDPQAHLSIKRSTVWTGYKVHVTETCDEESPHLLINVQTTAATTQDIEVTESIHQALAHKHLLPCEHTLDTGYVDGPHLVSSASLYGIELVGPVIVDPSWQGRAGQGFSVSDFAIDWQAHRVTCPEGKTSRKWKWAYDAHGGDRIHVEFGKKECLACPCRSQCTTAKSDPRQISFHPQAQHEAIQSAHILIATAIDVTRLLAFLMGVPRDATRVSRFAALAP